MAGLTLITDYYTKEIIGYSIGETLETKYPQEALEMALRHYAGKDLSELIHHSDRGVQYASYVYTSRLKDCKIRISMTESGNPKAVAERVNNTIKNELLKGMEFYRISDHFKKKEIYCKTLWRLRASSRMANHRGGFFIII